ncbi:alpha/beta fold hydrolase [Marinivivus vitaminiproducens]|uniref:alpha/beta fold hydrolase n=1 Tax=Marinivivus vitaminiproducens TaxID=3035935 RepID=UPI00279AB6F8|nr:alpha/beta fold hydrolase [Geminicoccaceae bacterium SCSIO 64248]
MRLRRSLIGVVLALGLAACARPVPSGAPETGAEAASTSRAWLPDGPPQARVLALHGFNDYSVAFTWFGTYAAQHGVAVHAYDQPGFGARPDAGLWLGEDALVEAVRRETARLRAEDPHTPLYLLGESMGGAVAMLAMASSDPPDVDGVILSAPAVWGDAELGVVSRMLLRLAAFVVPGLTLTGEGIEVTPSDNIEALRLLWYDPLVIKATRIDAIAGLVDVMEDALTAAPGVPGPLLALSGARDDLVPPQADRTMRTLLTADPCTGVVYPEGYHMLLRDRQRQIVWDDILSWIHGAVPPSGLASACGGGTTTASAAAKPPA